MGQLQQVKATYLDVRPAISPNDSTASASENKASAASAPETLKEERRQLDACQHDSWDPPLSINHLTSDQQDKVRQILCEVCFIVKR